jgi:hypothetical protein
MENRTTANGVCADAAHEAHRQARRRAAEERIRTAIIAILDGHLGQSWYECVDRHERLDEATACAIALGLWA